MAKIENVIEKKIISATNIEELSEVLKNLLQFHSVDEDGSLLNIRQLVEYVDRFRVEINPREHPPPHFHVRASGINASFSIENCELLEGTIDGRKRRIIEWWHQRSKDKLIYYWNKTRPSNCPVGPIKI